MERRKFVKSAIIASALPIGLGAQSFSTIGQATEKEWYEIRTYEMKLGGNLDLLKAYLFTVLKPAVFRAGANHFQLFSELGESQPSKYWLWIGYPNIASYQSAQNLSADNKYKQAAKVYDAIPEDQKIYNRYSSWLLSAFDGLSQALKPVTDASLYELRTYEGYSEDALRRKIQMFNKEELTLFYKVNLNPSFFGEMIAGPYRPCLTYMINFKDMEAHDTAWKAFVKHPDWIEMSSKPEYANSVSNIRKTFLEPVE